MVTTKSHVLQQAVKAAVKSFFIAQGKRAISRLALAGYPRGDSVDVNSLLDIESETESLLQVVRLPLVRGISLGAADALRVLKQKLPTQKSAGSIVRILAGAGLPDALRPAIVAAALEIESAPYWMAIAEGTRSQISGVVKQAISEDWTGFTMAANIRGAIRDAADARAELIAVAETVAAVNDGAMRATVYAQEQHPGSVLGKMWNTRGDEKVRESHQAMDGQQVPAEDHFTFPSGESAPYPIHWSLPAKERCGCRCSIQPVVIVQPDEMEMVA